MAESKGARALAVVAGILTGLGTLAMVNFVIAQLGGEVPGAAFAYALLRYGFAVVFGVAGYAWAMASIRAWKEMER